MRLRQERDFLPCWRALNTSDSALTFLTDDSLTSTKHSPSQVSTLRSDYRTQSREKFPTFDELKIHDTKFINSSGHHHTFSNIKLLHSFDATLGAVQSALTDTASPDKIRAVTLKPRLLQCCLEQAGSGVLLFMPSGMIFSSDFVLD